MTDSNEINDQKIEKKQHQKTTAAEFKLIVYWKIFGAFIFALLAIYYDDNTGFFEYFTDLNKFGIYCLIAVCIFIIFCTRTDYGDKRFSTLKVFFAIVRIVLLLVAIVALMEYS